MEGYRFEDEILALAGREVGLVGMDTSPHKPFIVIHAGEGSIREIAERAAEVLKHGNGVGIDFADMQEAAEAARAAGRRGKSWLLFQMIAQMMATGPRQSVTEISGTPPGVVIVDEFTEAAESFGEGSLDCIMMPEAHYRLIQEMTDPLLHQKVKLEPRRTKPWVMDQDWKQRLPRRRRRR